MIIAKYTVITEKNKQMSVWSYHNDDVEANDTARDEGVEAAHVVKVTDRYQRSVITKKVK